MGLLLLFSSVASLYCMVGGQGDVFSSLCGWINNLDISDTIILTIVMSRTYRKGISDSAIQQR